MRLTKKFWNFKPLDITFGEYNVGISCNAGGSIFSKCQFKYCYDKKLPQIYVLNISHEHLFKLSNNCSKQQKI